jgi:hypothetical protein
LLTLFSLVQFSSVQFSLVSYFDSRSCLFIPSTFLRRSFNVPLTFLRRSFDVPSTFLRRSFDVPSKYNQKMQKSSKFLFLLCLPFILAAPLPTVSPDKRYAKLANQCFVEDVPSTFLRRSFDEFELGVEVLELKGIFLSQVICKFSHFFQLQILDDSVRTGSMP